MTSYRIFLVMNNTLEIMYYILIFTFIWSFQQALNLTLKYTYFNPNTAKY